MMTTHILPNGLQLASEYVSGAGSVSLHLLLPAGSMCDTDRTDGYAALFLEMLFRGTKTLNTKALTHAFDAAGMQRSGSVGTHFIRLSATTTTDHLRTAMELLLAVVMEPSFPDSELDAAREGCLQGLAHLADDPQQEISFSLRSRHLDRPFHRSGLGTVEGLNDVTTDALRKRLASRSVPTGSIMAIAGGVKTTECLDLLTTLTAKWSGACADDRSPSPGPRGRILIERPTSQVHLSMAWDAPPAGHNDVARERLLSVSLGGTTSGRLFTEARQRRSLCYSIGSQYARTAEQGWVTLHASTTPENAEELVQTCLSEITRIASDLTSKEIERARRTIISSMTMQGESTAARAAYMANALAQTGQCLSLKHRIDQIERVSAEDVMDYAKRYTQLDPTIVAIGPAGSLPFEVL
jgi:predicted Zn-dependent peptidase